MQRTRIDVDRRPAGCDLPLSVIHASRNIVKVLLLAGLLLLVIGVGPAAAKGQPACWKTLINDWYDGRIDGTYPIKCYRDALNHLPTDVDTYSSARDDIKQALQERITQSRKSGGGTANGGGSSGGGGTSTAAARPAAAALQRRRHLERRRHLRRNLERRRHLRREPEDGRREERKRSDRRRLQRG